MTTWNEGTPAGTDYISGGDDIIRESKIAIRERMAREHYMLGSGDSADDGKHRFACGLDAAKPTAVAGHIYVATDTLFVYISPANGVWIPLRADDQVGVIKMFGGSTAPSGWYLCDGAWLSRTVDAALFAVIGTTYGAGDGVNYFTLPDFKGKVPVGFDASQTEFNALGKTGGEKTHVLTEAEMPIHTHSITDPGHTHAITNSTDNAGPNNTMRPGNDANGAAAPIIAAVTGISVGNIGGNTPHNILQPYVSVNYIIKY